MMNTLNKHACSIIILTSALIIAGCAHTAVFPCSPMTLTDSQLLNHAAKHLSSKYPNINLNVFKTDIQRESSQAVVTYRRQWPEVASPDKPVSRLMTESISVIITQNGKCSSSRSKKATMEIPNATDNI